MGLGDRYGAHRVIEPRGALPQAAHRLDNVTPPLDNEIGISVSALHITSTSFIRLWREAGEQADRLAEALTTIVAARGKFQDPVTGSGGVLMGRVDFVGPALRVDVVPGDPIVTMVSLALTPLRLERVGRVHPPTGQVEVDGYAVLFESGLWAKLPPDMPAPLAMLALDVAGAPAYAARHVRAGQRVLVIGGGKAGLLCLHEARKRVGVTGQVILVEKDPARCQTALALGLVDAALAVDAGDALEVARQVGDATGGALADLSFDCASLPGTEMAAILSTRDDGEIFFFSMATDFSRAALGAEGAGKPVRMVIGNGYIPGHAELALQVLRENPRLREFLSRLLPA
ncbi:MAG TPA: FAD-binding protein [Anaerolineae bacterium]|nr:FAD-binding protein [Anaerolineae bacterium]